MTGQPGDPRLEDELRTVLRRRDPGAATDVLRSWVQDVPEEAESTKPSQLRRPFAAVVGLAAVILVAVIGLTAPRHLGPATGPGASSPVGTVASASAVESPVGAFDPTLQGPGVSGTDDLSPAIPVVLACAALGILAMTVRGRRRFFPAIVAVVLAGWAVVAALIPVTVLDSGYGLGLNTVRAPQVPGSGEELLYELAPANGRFSVGLYLLADGLLPIRIEGIVSPLFGRDPRSFLPEMMPTALWIDREPNGGMSGPIRPFTPFDMPRSGQSIWLVGRAGACALGSAFDPSNPAPVLGFQGIDSLDVRVSVLGWPRTVHLTLRFRLVEPERQSCPEPTPEPRSSPSAKPSSR
jgi:hypothetical protein